jgi:hypothetical protein
MRRIALAAALLAAAAAPRAFAGEGVYLTIDAGYALWNKDTLKKNLAPQVGTDAASGLSNADLLTQQMPDGAVFGLHLGYNIAGHVGIEGSFALRPWNISSDTRGGIGIAGMAVRWFPLQGFVRPGRPFDVSLLIGADYFLMGGGGITDATGATVSNSSRGLDGAALELGGTIEAYPLRWLSIGVTPRIYYFDPLRYFTAWDKRDTGGQIPLTGQVGGGIFSISASLTFHFSPQPG